MGISVVQLHMKSESHMCLRCSYFVKHFEKWLMTATILWTTWQLKLDLQILHLALWNASNLYV